MDDGEISCLIPQVSLNGRPGDLNYCHMLIELTRLSSIATQRLSNAQAMRQSAIQLVKVIGDLSQRLDELKRSFRHILSLGEPVDSSRLPGGLALHQALALQYTYFCLVLDIHTPLTYPWSGIFTQAERRSEAFSQVENSCAVVIKVSRAAILTTRQNQTNAMCSSQ